MTELDWSDFEAVMGYPRERACPEPGCCLEVGSCVYCQYQQPFDAWCPGHAPGGEGRTSSWHIQTLLPGLTKCLSCGHVHPRTKGLL